MHRLSMTKLKLNGQQTVRVGNRPRPSPRLFFSNSFSTQPGYVQKSGVSNGSRI